MSGSDGLAVLRPKAIIGMIHVAALPGTPWNRLSIEQIADQAGTEAEVLVGTGVDALIIENMHDRPYLRRRVGPEVVAAMTATGLAVRRRVDVPLGVQILAGANLAAVAVAQACGGQFARVEGFVFAHLADEGLIEADAGRLLRYRRRIGADNVAIIADVKKKHSSHAVTADVDLADTTRAAEFFGTDGIVVTGTATGMPTNVEDVRQARSATNLPIFIGSGVTPDTLPELWPCADAFIVGSYIKREGVWSNEPEAERVRALLETASRLRGD